ncbi:DNA-directed RNA polymerase subunit alpha [sediment metagenome]|uniref:DNA-directed RNA polymerase n=1 Tax=sediment metagenome TaxID=749907 RepID=D9PK62_9ZZZZ
MLQKDILLPSELKIVSEKDNKGTYEINGLYPGYGHTLGNSLRRIILSSISGVGITKIKIEGISHEFTVIEDVKEDALTIVLNLKKVIFKLDSNERITLKLKKKGLGDVKASDIKLPTGVEIINPNQYLFSISKNTREVEIDIEVSKGLGYVTKEEIQHHEKVKVGDIVMDTSFAPIKRVSYEVANSRVGDRTDFNKLTIFIETDGSISPFDALNKSINIMIKQLSSIVGNKIEENKKEDISNSIETGETIAVLNLNEEILGKLANTGILQVSDLKNKTDDELLKIDGIDEEIIKEIKKALKNKN